MADADFDIIARDVMRSVGDTLKEAGGAIVREIQADVGISYPPPSTAGYPAHLRSGDYQNSIQSEVETEAEGRTLNVFTDCPYGGFLEDGTDRMAARPAFDPAMNRWESQLPEYLESNLDL